MMKTTLLSTRSNDGASDPLGRFWFGTMQNNFDKYGNDISIKQNIGNTLKVRVRLFSFREVNSFDSELGHY